MTHAVFVVHGVGGAMDEGTIGRNATLMRDNVSHILTKCFPKFQEQSGQRVEFFPVEWRTNLRLDEGLVDAITPQRVMGLRFGSIPPVPFFPRNIIMIHSTSSTSSISIIYIYYTQHND